MHSKDEIELDPETFNELLEINLFCGGYVDNIEEHIERYKHLLFYQGLHYTTVTDHRLHFKK